MSLFSLDILEPSLVKRPSQCQHIPLQALSSTSTQVSPAASSKQQQKGEERVEDAGPSRWHTPEFWLYGFAFVTVVPLMFWCAWDVSRGIGFR
jgi:hypothetical protein